MPEVLAPASPADAGGPAGDAPRRPPSRGPLAALRELVIVVVAALAVSFLVKTFLLAVFWVPSASMEDTLLIGDRVVVSKLTPGPFALHRGDVVVFADPGDGWLQGDGADGRAPVVHRGPVGGAVVRALTAVGVLPDDSRGHLVKRVVGLPGDTVSCRVGGRTTVDGHPVRESWLAPGAVPCDAPFTTRVPAGHLWVEGDNRQDSLDSRAHTANPGGGSVPERLVVGRAVARVWPLSRLGRISGHHDAYAAVSARS